MGVPEGWSPRTLGDMADLITKGTTPKTYGMDYTASGIPFLRVENITAGGTLSLDGVKYISPETHQALKRSQGRPGDVLISIAGALGRVAVIPDALREANMNQAVSLVRLRNNACHIDYLRHALHGHHVAVQVSLSKAALAQANLNLKQVGGLEVLLPPLPEQRKIAAILSSVDEAIEKTQAVIDQVQVVKKGLMQELLTKGLPGRHKKFKQTEIGEIPEDWEVVELQELCEPGTTITYGVVKPGPKDPSGVRFVRSGDLTTGVVAEEQLRTISKRVSDTYKRTLLRGGELLIALVGQPGATAIAPKSLAGANIARQVGLVRVNERLLPEFAKSYFNSPLGRKALLRESIGSVQQVINLRDLKTVELPLPSIEEQNAICDVLAAVAARLSSMQGVLRGKEDLKAALMSVLLTGELRVTP